MFPRFQQADFVWSCYAAGLAGKTILVFTRRPQRCVVRYSGYAGRGPGKGWGGGGGGTEIPGPMPRPTLFSPE